jgi:hypothetical protein|tara:strand:- start:572 stop:775 length:204 start_codon:yes stop_codon:yes gene_type:complete
MKSIISQHIEGISINGFEHCLDDDGEVMTFESNDDAIQFLLKKGYEWQDIGWSVFVGTVDEPDQVTY